MDNPTKIKLICKRFISKPHKKNGNLCAGKKEVSGIDKI